MGYKGIHITFKANNGLNAEIQITTEEHWELKKKSDEIYDKWRDVKDVETLSFEQKKEWYRDILNSKEMWGHFDSSGIERARNSLSDNGREFMYVSPEIGDESLLQLPSANSEKLPSESNFTILPSSKRLTSGDDFIDNSPFNTDINSISDDGNDIVILPSDFLP